MNAIIRLIFLPILGLGILQVALAQETVKTVKPEIDLANFQVDTLVASIQKKLPKGWHLETRVDRKLQVPGRPEEAEGTGLLFCREGSKVFGKGYREGGQLTLWVMKPGYAGTTEGWGGAALPAREMPRWQERRVFVEAGDLTNSETKTNAWPTWEADLKAAMKEADAPAQTGADAAKVKTARARLEVEQQMLTEVQARFKAGQATQEDVLRQEFNLEKARYGLEQLIHSQTIGELHRDLAKAELDRAKAQTGAEKPQADTHAKTAAEARMELAALEVQLAQLGLDNAQLRFRAGQATAEEVEEQQLKLVKAQAALAKLKAAQEVDAAWGEAVEGVSVRLVTEKEKWKAREVPTFKVEVRNQGEKDFTIHRTEAVHQVEVDGKWFYSVLDVDPKSLPFGPGVDYRDIAIRLKPMQWSGEKGAWLEWPLGKHTVRVVLTAEPVESMKEKPLSLVSNAVEIEIVAGDKADPAWGKAVEGVQVRLVADKDKWKAGETPTFKAEARNGGKKGWALEVAEEVTEIEVNGVWYHWTGPLDVITQVFGPGNHYEGIDITLKNKDKSWLSETGEKPMEVNAGKLTVRIAFTGLTVDRPKEKSIRVVSNAVEIEVLAEADDDKVLTDPGDVEFKHTMGRTHYVPGKLLSAQFVEMGKVKLGDREASVTCYEYENVFAVQLSTPIKVDWNKDTHDQTEKLSYKIECTVLDGAGRALKLVEGDDGKFPTITSTTNMGPGEAHCMYTFWKRGRDMKGGVVEIKTPAGEWKLAYPPKEAGAAEAGAWGQEYRVRYNAYRDAIMAAVKAKDKDALLKATEEFNRQSGEQLLVASVVSMADPKHPEPLMLKMFEVRPLAAIDYVAGATEVHVTKLRDTVQVQSFWNRDGTWPDDVKITLLFRLPVETEWSEAVNGLRARLVVKTPIVETAGPVAIESWIELENVGKESRWIMGGDGEFAAKLTVTGKDGKEVKGEEQPIEGMMKGRKWKEIKAGEKLKEQLAGATVGPMVKVEAGKPMGILDANTTVWRLPVGEYKLTAVYSSDRWESDASPRGAWHGKMELPVVTVEIRKTKAK